MRRFATTAALATLCVMSLVGRDVVANVVLITDTTPGTATNDGTIDSSEYAGFSTGINSGFGNVIGSNGTATAKLFVDSSSGGALNFGLSKGNGSFSDLAVIYIDSKAGGFSTTSGFTDNGSGTDPGRAAISGLGTASGRSVLNFASGFTADYAIAIQSGFAGVFALNNGASHTFITSANVTHVAANDWEMNLSLTDIGSTPGTAFKYVATYLNASNAFRSDEFQGVAAFGPGNPGNSTVTLADGDYNTFVSFIAPVPEASPALAIPCAVVITGLILCLRRRFILPPAV